MSTYSLHLTLYQKVKDDETVHSSTESIPVISSSHKYSDEDMKGINFIIISFIFSIISLPTECVLHDFI